MQQEETNEYYRLAMELADYDLRLAEEFNFDPDNQNGPHDYIDTDGLYESQVKHYALNMFTPKRYDNVIPF